MHSPWPQLPCRALAMLFLDSALPIINDLSGKFLVIIELPL
jgi:hypothetical protein